MSSVKGYVVCNNTNTIYPSNIEVNLTLDIEDIPKASFVFDPSEYTPELGSTVSIYLEKNNSGAWVFSGELVSVGDLLEGKTHRKKKGEARGWGKCLLERVTRERSRDNAGSIMTRILQPLVDDGLLSSLDIASTSETIKVDFSKGEKIRDALRNICSGESNETPLDWDFYVDNNKVFHAFPRDAYTSTLNIATLALEYSYFESSENIINKQKVIGGLYNTIGTDADYTEDTVNWTASDNLHRQPWTALDDVGSYCIECERHGAVGTTFPLWLKRTFSPSISVEEDGNIIFYIEYVLYNWMRIDESFLTFRCTVRLKTDSNNYFEWKLRHKSSCDQNVSVEKFPLFKVSLPWSKVSLPIGKKWNDSWTRVGSPDWNNITEFELVVDSPLPSKQTPNCQLFIDALSIKTRVYGIADESSTSPFGVREGEDLINDKLETDSECLAVAQNIVNVWKNPIKTIKNLSAAYNFDVQLGTNYPFDDGSISTTLSLRRISHILDEFDLRTEMDLSTRWIPSPERILKKFLYSDEKQNYDITSNFRLPTDPVMEIGRTGPTVSELPNINLPTSDIVGFYKFEEGEGTITRDYSEYANDGIIHGATFTTGIIGKALSFDGIDDYMTVQDSPSLRPQTLTVMAWIYNPDTAVSKHFINKRHSSADLSWRSYTLSYWSSNGYTFYINDGTQALTLYSNYNGDEGWHHVVGVYDGQDMQIYVDGELKNTLNVGAVTIAYDSNPLYLGGFDATPEGEQVLDEVLIFDRALSREEILSLYYFGAGLNPNRTRTYSGSIEPLSKNTGDIWYDTSTGITYRWNGIEWIKIGGSNAGAIDDITVDPPTFNAIAEEIDNSLDFRTWITTTINRVDNAGGYVLAYKKHNEDKWINIPVEQPDIGYSSTVRTDYLEAESTYDIRVCSKTMLGQNSDWSNIQTVVTPSNDVAPPAPQNLTATPVMNGALLSWDPVDATDLDYYTVKYGSDTPTTEYAKTKNTTIFWKKKDTDNYSSYNFQVFAVDTGGNISSGSNTVSVTPIQVKPWDLHIESRPWNADFKMWEDTVNYGVLYWSAKDGVSDATITFADNSTRTIDKNTVGTSFSPGIRYFYWDTIDTSLKNTTNYSDAVGEGKGLLVVADISTVKPSTYLLFHSYTPTIGAGAIAAKSIGADHLVADEAVITSSLQVGNNVIISDHITSVESEKIHLSGNVYLSNWRHPDDYTQINGGKIYTQSITSDKIAAKAITTEKLTVTPANLVPDGDFESGDVNKEWLKEGDGIIQLVTSPVHSGLYALRVTINIQNTAAYSRKAIECLPGQVLKARVYARKGTTGTAYFKIYWYDKDQQFITSTTIGSTTSTTYTLLEGEATVPTDAYYFRPYLETSGDAYFDDLYIKRQTAEGDIVADAVTTEKLRFDPLTSDPSDTTLTLWYNTSEDQLRFGGQNGQVGYIPRFPIEKESAPPENLLPNGSFEKDHDGNGVPDFWTVNGGASRTTSENIKGEASMYIPSGSQVISSFIPVREGIKYFARAMIKGSGTAYLFIYFYDSSKVQISNPYTSQTASTSWEEISFSKEAPTGARYAKVLLYSFGGTIYWDDIVLSEQRAAVPSTGVINFIQNQYYWTPTLGDTVTWISCSDTVTPDQHTEAYFFHLNFHFYGGEYYHNIRVRYRIHDVTNNKYYLSSTTANNPFIEFYSGYGDHADAFLMIPGDFYNCNLVVQVAAANAAAENQPIAVNIASWGYSPHTHH